MPTGYTSIISEKEISFKEFALRCARAFGACIEQREDSLDDVPKFRQYNENNFFEKVLKSEAPDLSFEAFLEEGANEIAEYEKMMQERLNLKKRYNKLIRDVSNWTPPSQDHQALKDFMLDQLNTSLRCDSDTSFIKDRIKELKNKKFQQWKKEKIESHNIRVKDAAEEIFKMKKSIEKTNKWIKELYESLPN